jgi:hypothetical protein
LSNNEDWGWPYMVYLIWQKHAKFMTLAKGFNSKIENQHSIYFSFLTKRSQLAYFRMLVPHDSNKCVWHLYEWNLSCEPIER